MGEGSSSTKKTCGECARFKVPDSGCSYASDIREGTIGPNDPACPEFYACRRSKSEKKKTRKQLKDSGVTGDGCFEAVYHNMKPCFLVENGASFRIAESIEVNEETFYPKEARNIPYEPYGIHEGPVPNREELFWKVWNEFETLVDVEPIWKLVLAACTMLTYQQEKMRTVPYIFLYGDNESGKSTVLQVLKALSYRPLYGVTIPSADLYGYLEDVDGAGCILEDEVQGINKDMDKVKIYKAGYKAGAVVPRTLITQNDRIIKYYRTFCFKACASEQIPQVKGFNERFLFISMVEGFPQKEWAGLTGMDLEGFQHLRDMLLKWRMLSRDWQMPEVHLPFKGRLKELWSPLLQTCSGLTVYNDLFNFAKDQQNERLSGKQNTLEGHIVKVVVDLSNEAKDPCIPFQTIWMDLAHDLDGKLDDRKPHVMDTSEFFNVTKNKVGYRLREIVCGKSKPIRDRDAEGNDTVVKAYVFDPEKLRRVARKYGCEFVTKLPSLPSSEGAQAREGMNKNHENNVEKDVHAPEEQRKLGNLVTAQNGLLLPSSTSKSAENKSVDGESGPNSVVSLWCPFCKAQGKKMFFSCDCDLKLHVDAFHNGSPHHTS
jgi:hypothetical protein